MADIKLIDNSNIGTITLTDKAVVPTAKPQIVGKNKYSLTIMSPEEYTVWKRIMELNGNLPCKDEPM